jgi:hypothetical protein
MSGNVLTVTLSSIAVLFGSGTSTDRPEKQEEYAASISEVKAETFTYAC